MCRGCSQDAAHAGQASYNTLLRKLVPAGSCMVFLTMQTCKHTAAACQHTAAACQHMTSSNTLLDKVATGDNCC